MAKFLLRNLFERLGRGTHGKRLRVEFVDGSSYQNWHGTGHYDVLIRFNRRAAEWYSLIFFYQGLLESYVHGDVELEGQRPIATLATIAHNVGLDGSGLRRRLGNPLNALRRAMQEYRQNNTDRAQAIRNADFHYSHHLALFELMLGETVGYSEGLWTNETKTLDQAKYNNYEYVCRKLRLKPGLKVLEVGPGWGYMPICMSKRYGAEVTVYNPVRRQNDYMRKRFCRHGLGDKIRLVEGDHRDIISESGTFDRFVSIGVHEHAGYSLKQYRLWANAIAASLKDGGIGVVSTTSFMDRYMTNFLTLKYIFPGGHLPSLPHTLEAFDRAGLMLVELENLWPHYQRTLNEWSRNFAEHWPEIRKADPVTFTEEFRRAWTMYLEGTRESFSSGLDLSHIVFIKGRDPGHYLRPDSVFAAGAELIGGDQKPECYR